MLLSVAIILLTSACSPAYITPRLPMPMKPGMPQLTNADLECVSDDVYFRVAGRDLAHSQYEKRLEAVIRSTWSDK